VSKKRRKRNPVRDSTASKNTPATRKRTVDSFSNPAARLGFGTPNMLDSTEYVREFITRDFITLNTLFRQNWIVKRVIETVPQDMLKNWYKIDSQISPDALKKLSRLERTTGIRAKTLDALKWGRLYGGAAAVMMIEGHEDILDQPLDFDLIMPDSFKGLLVFDRWSGINPDGISLVGDVSDPDFGLPEFYTISDEALGIGLRVHHSRVLRFIGTKLPPVDEITENYWGASIVEPIMQELKKYDNTSFNVAMLVFKACVRIYAMKDIDQIGVMDEEALEELYNTLLGMNWMMSNQGLQIIGKDDTFQTHQISFSGLDKVLETFMLDLSGAAGIPVTKLFGRSPAGLNATGESDLQNYYDSIEEMQESELRPVFDRLLPVMCMSAFGAIPEDLEYSFVNCRRPTEEEKKNIATQVANAIVALVNAGIISKKTALTELRNSEEMTGMWASISDEIISQADNGNPAFGEDLPPGLLSKILEITMPPPQEEAQAA